MAQDCPQCVQGLWSKKGYVHCPLCPQLPQRSCHLCWGTGKVLCGMCGGTGKVHHANQPATFNYQGGQYTAGAVATDLAAKAVVGSVKLTGKLAFWGAKGAFLGARAGVRAISKQREKTNENVKQQTNFDSPRDQGELTGYTIHLRNFLFGYIKPNLADINSSLREMNIDLMIMNVGSFDEIIKKRDTEGALLFGATLNALYLKGIDAGIPRLFDWYWAYVPDENKLDLREVLRRKLPQLLAYAV